MKNVFWILTTVALVSFIYIDRFFVNPGEACAARGIEACSPKCGSCSANVKGSWTFYDQERNNSDVTGPFELTLSQSGYRVINTNESTLTFVGTVFGSSIDFSITVSGEEIEGYVKHCEGHVLTNNKIFAVCDDRDGVRSTFTGKKN